MCGIAAFFAYGADAPPVDRRALERVRERMAARGPDGAGLWISDDGRVGLAHRRLAIIDLSAAAAQPMAAAGGRYRIVYNGEIYNYRALRDELAAQGQAFATDSDTEVLLHLYARLGPNMVHRLRGMYAFAIWDQAKRGVFLARDGFGIKPLYYADDGATLRVASQVKALIAGGGIDTAPAPAGHVGFFLWGWVPEPHTLYRGIRALPAGTSLWIDHSGYGAPHVHFDPGAVLREAEPAPLDWGALAEALADSVAHHLVADVPVGVFLSSGLDSTTLAAFAAAHAGTRLRTVTLGFEEYRETPNDETKLAQDVARLCATDHRTCWVARAAFESELGRVLAAMDQPSIDGVNTYFVARAAAEAGLKVAISGLGGDELFGGYPSFRELPRLVRALAPFRLLPGAGRALRWIAAPALRRLTSPKYAGLIEYGTTYGQAYLLRRGLFMPWELPQVLDPDMAREGWRALRQTAALEATVSGLRSSRLRVAVLETAWYMRNQLLRDSDWAGMAHSLEIRVPLVDTTLFRRLAPMLAGATPPGKRGMAACAPVRLPDSVLARPKTGFSVPVREWTGGGGRSLRDWARQVYRQAAA